MGIFTRGKASLNVLSLCLLSLAACTQQPDVEEVKLFSIGGNKPEGVSLSADLRWHSRKCGYSSVSGESKAGKVAYTHAEAEDRGKGYRLDIVARPKSDCDWYLAGVKLLGHSSDYKGMEVARLSFVPPQGEGKHEIKASAFCEYIRNVSASGEEIRTSRPMCRIASVSGGERSRASSGPVIEFNHIGADQLLGIELNLKVAG